jgi:hypothetical protein
VIESTLGLSGASKNRGVLNTYSDFGWTAPFSEKLGSGAALFVTNESRFYTEIYDA